MKELSKEVVERVRQCVIAAGAEFDGIQTSFTALPQVIFQTVEDFYVFSVEFNPLTFNDKILIQRLEFEIVNYRATKGRRAMKLKEKLHAVYHAIDMIEKAGYNTSQKYGYIKAADVTREIRKQLIEQKVYAEINFDFVGAPFTIARAKEKDAPFSAVLVKCSIKFHDLESDDILTSSGLGTGADTGDKAAYKAMTGAMKYALKNGFLVPDEADPEADESVDESNSRQAADIPDFQDAKRGEAAPKQERPTTRPTQAAPKTVEENPFDSQPSATSSPKSQASTAPAPAAAAPSTTSTAPTAATEKGDAYEGPDNDRLPTEAELIEYRKKFTAFGNDMADKGKLKASKGLPVGIKLKVFLCSITKAESPKNLTLAQWNDFFSRVDKAVAQENGFVNLTKLINKTNGIEEKK